VNSARGTTIQIYLPDDDPRGIRVAEVTTGIVSAIQVPRSQIQQVHRLCMDLQLQESSVYILIESDQGSPKPRAYIGQTDTISRRLRENDQRKDFWETAIFFVSQKGNFTPTHTEYLEWHGTDVASKIGRYNVVPNKSACPIVRLPLKQEILKCFESIRILSAALGFPIFEPIVSSSNAVTHGGTLYCKGSGADARGLMVGSEFIVRKGSIARSRIALSALGKIGPLRDRLMEAGVLVRKGRSLIFMQDFPFNSPSTAANIVLGRNVNGWDFWKDHSGRTIDDLYRKE
jgi:uncharacterized protein DUF4357